MSSQISNGHFPLVCTTSQSSYERKTCFRAHKVVSKENLTSHRRSKWLAWRAHSTAGKDEEERRRYHKWELRLGVNVPQVPRHFDFSMTAYFCPEFQSSPPFSHRSFLGLWRSGAIGALAHIHTQEHVWIDAQKNTSDSSMKPAVATKVTTLTLLWGLKRNDQTVSRGRVCVTLHVDIWSVPWNKVMKLIV